MSMFDPIAEQIVYHFATDNMWTDGASGDVESPAGYYGMITVPDTDSALLLLSEWHAIGELLVIDCKPADLVGHWFAQCDSNGNHYVMKLQNLTDLVAHYKAADDQYSIWQARCDCVPHEMIYSSFGTVYCVTEANAHCNFECPHDSAE